MRWQYEKWVKLYVREEGSFSQLPLYVRALAGELLKICDVNGRIVLRGKQPWEAIAFQLGADLSDRRLLKKHVPLLIADGFLELADGDLFVRNFTVAQTGVDRVRVQVASSSCPDDSDSAVTETRPERERDTTETRLRHESDTRSESTPQNQTGLSRRSDLEDIREKSANRSDQILSSAERSSRRREARKAIWDGFLRSRESAAASIGATAPMLYSTDLGYDQVVHRLRELEEDARVEHAEAVAHCLRVIARAAFEAKRDGKLEWFGGSIWDKRNFDRLAARPVKQQRPSIEVYDLSAHDNPFSTGAIAPMFTDEPE